MDFFSFIHSDTGYSLKVYRFASVLTLFDDDLEVYKRGTLALNNMRRQSHCLCLNPDSS